MGNRKHATLQLISFGFIVYTHKCTHALKFLTGNTTHVSCKMQSSHAILKLIVINFKYWSCAADEELNVYLL